MDRIFLVDNNKFTYSNLLLRLQNDDYYYELEVFEDLYEFILNFIKALLYSKNIVILDKALSTFELTELGINDIGKKINILPEKKVNSNLLIELIKGSKSNITIFTSGSTGLPKKVTHDIKSLTRLIRTGEKYRNNIWGLAYNPTHIAGIQVILQALFNFNTIVNIFDADTIRISQSIENCGITHISSTPTYLRMLTGVGSTFSKVQRITTGGEKYDERLETKLKKCFPNAQVNNIYASTEFGSLLVSKGNYFSIPIELTDKIKIEKNELIVHKSLNNIISKDENEWYHTGDLIEKSIENPDLFKFIGRDCEQINTGGYKVNPYEVEEAINSIPNISASRVYGRDNSVVGKILCADIQMKDAKSNLDIQTLRSELSSLLQDYKIPRIYKFVDKIDTTRTGKIKRELK